MHARRYQNGTATLYAIATIILFLAVAFRAAAQQGEVMLSREGRQPYMIPEAAIQQAAQIDSVVLAAWGTTAGTDSAGADSAGHVALYAQIVRNGVPRGTVALVTGPEARPSVWLRIVPMGDRFLVLWNDRRYGTDATYMCAVDTAGRIGTGQPLGYDSIWTMPGPFAVRTATGYRLLINTGLNGVQARDLDTAGRAVTAIFTFPAAHIHRIIHPADDPFTSVVDALSAYIELDSSGNPLRSMNADPEVYIHDDGRRITFDSTHVYVFRRLFDSIPERTITYPHVAATIYPVLAALDSTGRVVVLHAGITNPRTQDNLVAGMVYATTEIAPGTFSAPLVVGEQVMSHYYWTWDIEDEMLKLSVERDCGETVRIAITIHESISWYATLPTVHRDSTGVVTMDMKYGRRTWCTSPECCTTNSDIGPTIARIASDTSSAVTLHSGGAPVLLQGPLAAHYHPVDQVRPGLVRNNTGMTVTWIAGGFPAAALAADWHMLPEAMPDSVRLGAISYPNPANAVLESETYRAYAQEGGGCISMNRQWVQSGGLYSTHIRGCDVIGYVAGGWKLLFAVDSLKDPYSILVLDAARNPGNGQLMVAPSYLQDDGTILRIATRIFDSAGTLIAAVDSLEAPPARWYSVAPRGTRTVTTDNSGRLEAYYSDGQSADMYSRNLQSAALSKIHRMQGPYLLRTWPGLEITANALRFELYDTAGYPHGTAWQSMPARPAEDLAFAQSPYDSTIACVDAGDDGIWLTIMDKGLNTLQPRRKLTEHAVGPHHPAALFRRDSLYIAWDDRRNGTADIFGLTIPTGLSASARSAAEPGEACSIGLQPNPAATQCTITREGALQRTLRVQIADVMGTVVRTIDLGPGTTAAGVSLVDLPSGIYIVHALETGIAARRLVVQR
ncbi:MAG: T9SS type A sorting domain-containing protein [Bacteroidetes bacterium]|nr:T9SS type A sorting domain-containing protein [Bacteroidota bacterium]